MNDDPLTGCVPAEIALPRAPLEHVLAQVVFPQILAVDDRDAVRPFQQALSEEYPDVNIEQHSGFILSPSGAAPAQQPSIWRFADIDDVWRVSLAPDFLALETKRYSSRDDFLARFSTVLEALARHIKPKMYTRIGVRYIDRVTGPDAAEIEQFIRSEMLGIARSPLSQHVAHFISEGVFDVPEPKGRLLVRWGSLPRNATVDPATIRPAEEQSWILDIDMMRQSREKFEPSEIVASARSMSERVYAFFRWAVTDQFLNHFGGKP